MIAEPHKKMPKAMIALKVMKAKTIFGIFSVLSI